MSHPVATHDEENELPEDIEVEDIEDRDVPTLNDTLTGERVEDSFTSEKDHETKDPDSLKY